MHRSTFHEHMGLRGTHYWLPHKRGDGRFLDNPQGMFARSGGKTLHKCACMIGKQIGC